MYIESVVLRNFADLKEGTGLDEIKIDFTDAIRKNKNLYFLFGRNGSGKSTLLSMLHPFSKNYTDRDIVIIPDREDAYKEIVYDINGHKLKIEHHYTVKNDSIKTRSYIYINDVIDEATKKGDISVFNERISDLLNIDKGILKISRLGTDIDSFVELSPSNRKAYIGKLMPEIEEWLNMYKTVMVNIKQLKSNITSITKEIAQIKLDDDYEHQIQVLQNEIIDLESKLIETSNNIAVLNYQINSSNDNMKVLLESKGISNDTDIIEQINKININIGNVVKEINEYFTKYNKLSEKIKNSKDAETVLNQIKTNIANTNNILVELMNDKKFVLNEIESYRSQINNLQSKVNISNNTDNSKADLINKIKLLEDENLKLMESLNSSNAAKINYLSTLDYNKIDRGIGALYDIETKISTIRSKFSNQEILELATSNNFNITALNNSLSSYISKNNKVPLEDLLNGLTRFSFQHGYYEAESILMNRLDSVKCRDPSCGVLEHINSKYSKSKISENCNISKYKKEEFVKLIESYNHEDPKVLAYNETINNIKLLLETVEELKQYDEFIKYMQFSDVINDLGKFIEVFILKDYSYVEELSSIRKYIASIDLVKKYNHNNERIKEYKDLFEKYKQYAEMHNANLTSISDLTLQHNEKLETLNALNKAIEEKNISIGKFNGLLQLTETIHKLFKTYEEYVNMYSILEDIRSKYSDVCNFKHNSLNTINSLNSYSNALNFRIKELKDRLNEMNINSLKRTELYKKLETYEMDLEKSEAIAYYSSPTKGAPIEYIKGFLVQTEEHVNLLLDIAFDGDFRISFKLNDNEFKIPITLSSGTIIDDINYASSGQKALVKTTLSFALIKQIIGESGLYNIICLDEIDGVLDKEKNKERFVNIIAKLITDLNIQQLFCISHNDNFQLADCGLLLFPGHNMPIRDSNFMDNKVIVTNLGEE